MAVAELEALSGLIDQMLKRLDKQAAQHRLLDRYYEGSCALPPAIKAARITRAYRLLMPVAGAPWGSLIVDTVQDRLEPTGIRSEDREADRAVWRIWQANQMDAEVKLALNSTLISGRSYVTVWPRRGRPQITLDSPEQMVVLYAEGSRRERVAALRRWVDDADRTQITVHLPRYSLKLQEAQQQSNETISAGGTLWEPRPSEGVEWVVENPWNVVPVVEIGTNRRLKPGTWAYARGEYEHCLALIDRINLLTFLGLVVAFWMGFPLRVVIGEKILRDDKGNLIPPFDAHASGLAQLEDPNVKLDQYDAADRDNLAIDPELNQLAALTKTPRTNFPIRGDISNVSADAIRALSGGLYAKVGGIHKPFIGEGLEGVLRLCGLMSEDEIIVPPAAQLQWADHESRSLAERSDAFTKLAARLPWQAAAELGLSATSEQISRWEAQFSGSAFATLLSGAREPARLTPALSDL
jgi:hypothetical protein